MTGSLDISTTHRKEISALLSHYLPGVEVWAFGSRVKWSSRPNSDLDIVAFSGLDKKSEIVQLREALMESSLPFRVDLHVWQELPESFQENIKSGYVVLQEALPGTLPRIEQQRAIADALGALANKIRLNLQKNETLEAMARAIFKSWFVDFDPVRAKAEGRDTHLPPHIADLFPDSFEESELGLIPKGWAVLPLSDIINIVGGGTPKTNVSGYWDGDIPWFSVVDAPNENDVFVMDTEKHITQSGLENSSTKILRVGTTIISARGTVGKCALVGNPMAMNQSCYGIQAKYEHGDYFIYFNIRHQIGNLQKAGHGSVFNTITRETFNYIKSTIPPNTLTKAFDETIFSLMLRIVNNLNESNSLAKMRDILLPKLISGEIRVPDAED